MQIIPISRPATLVAGTLAILGSISFMYGGSFHPHVNSDIGTVGSETFYRHFIQLVVAAPHWERFHVMILAGPVLWALSIAGFAHTADATRRPLWTIAIQSMGIAAVLWAVTFALDGFITALHARAVLSSANPVMDAINYRGFVANQNVVARLGALSWFAFNFGIAIVAASMISLYRSAPKRALLGVFGVAIGAWSMISCLNGEFAPAPFTSHYWTLTALATSLWFALLGLTMLTHRPAYDQRTSNDAVDARSGSTVRPFPSLNAVNTTR